MRHRVEAGADALAAYLDTERQAVEAALLRAIEELAASLPSDVAAAVRHGVTGGGKRLRPVLCAGAYAACGGGTSAAVYDLSASLELIHAYSLMHDDLPCMDDADLRRGRPTTHKEHGEAVTKRAGAALIPMAALQALAACERLGCEPKVSKAVTAVLLRAAGAGGMVGGQWVDLEGEGMSLGSADLDDLHRRKTGALLAASLEMGALAAGAEDVVVDAFRAYGRAIGLAFQIVDDVLDATQSAETLGKNPSDVAHGKSTYVSLHGLDEARRRARAESDRAGAALTEAGIDAPMLAALARFVVERQS
ncbi:MAG TPA: polyprenyl synthetase family protein [Longimicrobiales bacterium]|nr:polyprenyl synthetase family protein [Longimicrobiales bacterium]